MAKIDFEKLLLDYIKFKEKLPHYKYIAPQQIPYLFNKLLEKQGLEYKDGKIVEIKQEPPMSEYGDMHISKDLEDRLTSINEKLCELQGKLGDIYAIVSKLNMTVSNPQYPEHILKPGVVKCDTSNAHLF